MIEPLAELNSVDIKRIVTEDEDGEATRAIVRSLHQAGAPLARMLEGSLSWEEQRMSHELAAWIEQAECTLVATWEQLHPGRQL